MIPFADGETLVNPSRAVIELALSFVIGDVEHHHLSDHQTLDIMQGRSSAR